MSAWMPRAILVVARRVLHRPVRSQVGNKSVFVILKLYMATTAVLEIHLGRLPRAGPRCPSAVGAFSCGGAMRSPNPRTRRWILRRVTARLMCESIKNYARRSCVRTTTQAVARCVRGDLWVSASVCAGDRRGRSEASNRTNRRRVVRCACVGAREGCVRACVCV